MKALTLVLPNNKKPYYLRIAEAIRNAIMQGHMQRGELLPSTRQLASTFRVHRHTIMSGLAELVAEGWIIAKERQSFSVSLELPNVFFKVKQETRMHSQLPFKWRTARALLLPPYATFPVDHYRYHFQSGLPDLRLFPHDELRLLLNDAFKKDPFEMLGYDDPAGHPALIEAIKLYLRRMRAIVDRDIIVTHGSQEAIFHVAQLLLKPNDWVAVERLGYFPAWEAFKAAGAKIAPMQIDRDGLCLDSLERLLKNKKIRLIYVTPLHQFPTTATLNVSRRIGLYHLSTKYGVPILEDDYDHEFHYRSEPLAPLASQDPAEQVIYISTFSKVLYPSARIGFIAAPRALAEQLKIYKRITSRQNDTMLQFAVAKWIEEGGFERHLRRMRRVYEERRKVILTSIEKSKMEGVELSYQEPDGGMAIWLNVHTDADKLMMLAAKQGVRVSSESFYSLNKCKPTHLRLGFANQNPVEINAGFAILSDILKKQQS